MADLHELWRRIALSVLLSNTDDHLRNHGFVRAESGWRLSPAFDMNPNPEAGPRLLSMAIDDADTEARVDLVMGVREAFRLAEPEALGMLQRIERAVSDWRSVAGALGIERAEIERMEPAFEHSEREAARGLLGSPA